MWSNSIVKSVAILSSTALWLYAMWIYTNAEMNGWQSGWVFMMAIVGMVGIAFMEAMNSGNSSSAQDRKDRK